MRLADKEASVPVGQRRLAYRWGLEGTKPAHLATADQAVVVGVVVATNPLKGNLASVADVGIVGWRDSLDRRPWVVGVLRLLVLEAEEAVVNTDKRKRRRDRLEGVLKDVDGIPPCQRWCGRDDSSSGGS